MQPGKLYIHATNVHQGGGKSLLSAVIKALQPYVGTVCLLDSRMVLPDGAPEHLAIRWVPPTLLQRLRAERWLASVTTPQDTVLCFGNLPPLFALRGHCVVFVQNRYLVDPVDLGGFPWGVRWRLRVERLWLASRLSSVATLIVQTPSMKGLMERKAGKVPVRVLPFAAHPGGYGRTAQQMPTGGQREHDFVYIASGEPHKNHQRLFAAWRLLAQEGFFPSLCVTLNPTRFPSLCDEFQTMIGVHAIKAENVGELPHNEVLALYGRCAAVIFPSTFESFGLPLIEARQAGLPVLASELDYVRDVIDAEQSFDPASPVSIARAVKRHLGMEESKLPLLDAEDFLGSVLSLRNPE
ncbi:MAG: glycosyltransferase [Pseudomonadota bacterium]